MYPHLLEEEWNWCKRLPGSTEVGLEQKGSGSLPGRKYLSDIRSQRRLLIVGILNADGHRAVFQRSHAVLRQLGFPSVYPKLREDGQATKSL